MSEEMPPKPPPMEPLSGELVPVSEPLEPVKPPPVPEGVLDDEAKMALAFLKAGAPLQDGTPDNPVEALNEIRKANK